MSNPELTSNLQYIPVTFPHSVPINACPMSLFPVCLSSVWRPYSYIPVHVYQQYIETLSYLRLVIVFYPVYI